MNNYMSCKLGVFTSVQHAVVVRVFNESGAVLETANIPVDFHKP